MNKNVGPFSLQVDKSIDFWTNQLSERQTAMKPVKNVMVIKKGSKRYRQMFTVAEFESAQIIGRAYKAYCLRNAVKRRVERKRQLKKLRKAIAKAQALSRRQEKQELPDPLLSFNNLGKQIEDIDNDDVFSD